MTRSILLAMDFENDLVHEDGPNGKQPLGLEAKRRRVLENTSVAIAKARHAGLPVGYVRLGFGQGYAECSNVSPVFTGIRDAGLLKLGTWGTEVHPAIAPQARLLLRPIQPTSLLPMSMTAQ
jgi:nicotinamidase-related amidase